VQRRAREHDVTPRRARTRVPQVEIVQQFERRQLDDGLDSIASGHAGWTARQSHAGSCSDTSAVTLCSLYPQRIERAPVRFGRRAQDRTPQRTALRRTELGACGSIVEVEGFEHVLCPKRAGRKRQQTNQDPLGRDMRAQQHQRSERRKQRRQRLDHRQRPCGERHRNQQQGIEPQAEDRAIAAPSGLRAPNSQTALAAAGARLAGPPRLQLQSFMQIAAPSP
jgi:hypothetical protein